jgi:hypothetical protein
VRRTAMPAKRKDGNMSDNSEKRLKALEDKFEALTALVASLDNVEQANVDDAKAFVSTQPVDRSVLIHDQGPYLNAASERFLDRVAWLARNFRNARPRA